jgi:hypothetical protein
MNSWKQIIENQQKIGRLTNFEYSHKNKYGHIFLKARCECGNLTVKRSTDILKAFRIHSLISCNCGQKELVQKQGLNNRIYKINNNLYYKSKEKSYIIGLLAADGYNSSNSIELTLQKKDIDILIKIKKFLNYTGTIKVKENKALLRIYNKQLCDYLKTEGICKNKTFKYKVPSKYKKDIDFWRGFIDGDGCIYNYKYNYGIHLIGTKNLINNFRKFFNLTNKVSRLKNSNIYQINITSKKSIFILDKLYLNSTIYLERKYKKYLEIKNKIHE